MTTTALTVLRQQLLRELGLGLVIPNGDITAIGATSITAANSLRNSLWGTTRFSDLNAGIFRPTAASSADYFRFAGDLTNSTGALAHTGANYTDTTVGTEVIELWYWGVRPEREIIDSLNRVDEFEFITSHHLLSTLSRFDGGMELSTDSDYTDVGTPGTSAKTSTHQQAHYGPRMYRLTNANANEGTRSAAVNATQSRRASAFAIVAADVGTASFQIRDSTNSVDVGTAVTHSYRRPMLVAIKNQELPSTCEAVRLSMLGTESTADIYWNQVGLYLHDNLMLHLPTFIDESFKAFRLMQMVPKVQIATDVYDAGSLEPRPLTEGVDYWLVINHADAIPYKVRLRDESLYDWPIFVEYRRPQSDLTTFAADETATVSVAKHNLLPRWKMDVLQTIYNGAAAPKHVDWDNQMRLANDQLIIAKSSRPIQSIAPARPRTQGVHRL